MKEEGQETYKNELAEILTVRAFSSESLSKRERGKSTGVARLRGALGLDLGLDGEQVLADPERDVKGRDDDRLGLLEALADGGHLGVEALHAVVAADDARGALIVDDLELADEATQGLGGHVEQLVGLERRVALGALRADVALVVEFLRRASAMAPAAVGAAAADSRSGACCRCPGASGIFAT